ncbi:hypothetical protein GGF46_002115 [Coemansia sp. RSA 552]|nr:hypothetical protein GGF46_002115 [Coemansia sp. RSA 552]
MLAIRPSALRMARSRLSTGVCGGKGAVVQRGGLGVGAAIGVRMLHERRRRAQWVRPALYTAGGVAVVVVAWPVLRLVVTAGLGYGVYRLVRWGLMVRRMQQELSGSGLFGAGGLFRGAWDAMRGSLQVAPHVLDAMHDVALQSLTASRDVRVRECVGSRWTGLGTAVEAESVHVSDGGQAVERVVAVFPVDGAPGVFVRASGSLGTGTVDYVVNVDCLELLVNNDNDDVTTIYLDVALRGLDADESQPKHKIRDADYREL